MHILFDPTGAPEGLAALLTQLDADPACGGILVLACDENGYTPDNLNAVLKSVGKPLFGGVFPQILRGRERLQRGVLAIGMPGPVEVMSLTAVSQPGREYEAELQDAFSAATDGTMFVFVDGFAAHISVLIESLYNQFGLEINYLGGGAGSLSLQPKPCIIGNQGLIQDGAVLAHINLPSGIGVAHGWLPVSEAFKVTEAEGNVIHSLDWRPAYAVYRDVVEAHSGRCFDDAAFFDIAKAYPFGMARLGAEMVVRDPLMLRADSLVCVGEVPVGGYVHILHGDRASLLTAAAQARGLAEEAMAEHPASIRLFVDCISRVLFLEDDFHLELETVGGDSLPMVGALTIGEIANNGQDSLEFYNKTSVVGLL